MPYKSIITAEPGWFYLEPSQANRDPNTWTRSPMFSRVAAWALTDDDKVIGLIGAQQVLKRDGTPHEPYARLHLPDAGIGYYKHLNDFTKAELDLLTDLQRPLRGNI